MSASLFVYIIYQKDELTFKETATNRDDLFLIPRGRYKAHIFKTYFLPYNSCTQSAIFADEDQLIPTLQTLLILQWLLLLYKIQVD